jgi:hypothetical protein
MANVFDPALYLDSTISEPTVRRPPAAAGVDYPFLVKDVKVRTWQRKDDPSKSGIALDVQLEISLTPDEARRVGQEKIILTDGFILELTEGGTIDNSPGRNRRVRQYREAFDMNKPGDTWSPRRMIGRGGVCQLTHEVYQGDIQERIGALREAS